MPFAAIFLALIAVWEDASLGALLVGGGIGRLLMTGWLGRFEQRTGYRVLRVKGFDPKPRVVLAWKDPAPAQRTPAHAQPEAARRAP